MPNQEIDKGHGAREISCLAGESRRKRNERDGRENDVYKYEIRL